MFSVYYCESCNEPLSESHVHAETVVLKCDQTGGRFTAKVRYLEKENKEPLERSDLEAGCNVLVDIGGRPYGVQIVCLEGV